MKEVDSSFAVEETRKSGEPGPHHPFFGLLTSDLTLIRPIADTPGGWRSPLSGSCTYIIPPLTLLPPPKFTPHVKHPVSLMALPP